MDEHTGRHLEVMFLYLLFILQATYWNPLDTTFRLDSGLVDLCGCFSMKDSCGR